MRKEIQNICLHLEYLYIGFQGKSNLGLLMKQTLVLTKVQMRQFWCWKHMKILKILKCKVFFYQIILFQILKNVRIIELSCCTHFSPLFKRALSVLTSVTADLCQDIKEDFSLNGALDGNLPQMKLKNWVRPSTIFSILSSTNNIH